MQLTGPAWLVYGRAVEAIREHGVPLDAASTEMKVNPRQATMHVYEVRPRKDKRGVDLNSDVLPFGRLWYGGRTQSEICDCVDPKRVANSILWKD